jgi:hypothetical protein
LLAFFACFFVCLHWIFIDIVEQNQRILKGNIKPIIFSPLMKNITMITCTLMLRVQTSIKLLREFVGKAIK